MGVGAKHNSNPLRHCAQSNSLRVGGFPPIEKLLLQPLPRPLVAPHPLLDQIVPGLVHQAAGLQVLRGKVEEAGDKEVFTSFSDGKQLADIVHLDVEGVFSVATQFKEKRKYLLLALRTRNVSFLRLKLSNCNEGRNKLAVRFDQITN